MAQKLTRDWVYMAIVAVQLIGMILLDFTEFYPESLYISPTAPLHFLTVVRSTYVANTGDPFFGEKFNGAWFHGMFYVELFVQFPLAVYIVWTLASKKPSSGQTELAGLAFGCLTGMGSVACLAELQSMGPELVTDAHKLNLFWGTYLPFAIIPGVMAVDMYTRLLRRVSTSEVKPKTQ
ncbi:hypothetical protein FSARC_6754 [Fusarium sarcochroum]|uniref:Efficient mitochondria targeting-associated protein 19 n=1 Tax=Fusarium sarcochroum TaxID=1208366 RepID=A0A8H4TWS7_9HYPO|nr:hypothetical protein FSARC_6754 [Fusarium sarcochroum]